MVRMDFCNCLAFDLCYLGRAGVPMEVMGLMLGDFVDDYTVKVVDVFAMPQSGTGVSVEAVDPVFQVEARSNYYYQLCLTYLRRKCWIC